MTVHLGVRNRRDLSLIYCSATMLALGFPHALALGILAGVLEFIPIVGWVLSATTIIGVGLLTRSHWIWIAALLGLWRLLMDYVISPRVTGVNWKSIPCSQYLR